MVMSKLVLEVDRIREMMGLLSEGPDDNSWNNEDVRVYDYVEGRNTVPMSDRYDFDVDKLVNSGAVFITPAMDGDPNSPTYKEWLDEDGSHLITLYNVEQSSPDGWIHKAITKSSDTSGWKNNLVEKLYDGKYNQILWSLEKLGIDPNDMLIEDNSLQEDDKSIIVDPSERTIKSICDSAKFCKAQGPITFGQLKAIVESAKSERLAKHMGEGGFKAIVRLLPWFLPQLALGGFIAAGMRALNKIVKPGLTETTSYKTWWGRTIMRVMDIAEGELSTGDPFSKIFFISDGLMNMMNEENKVKFARHIADLASQKPNDEPVPEFFVENELRNWVNQRFLLDPPLEPKQTKENERLD